MSVSSVNVVRKHPGGAGLLRPPTPGTVTPIRGHLLCVVTLPDPFRTIGRGNRERQPVVLAGGSLKPQSDSLAPSQISRASEVDYIAD